MRAATLFMLVFFLVSCEAKEPTGGGGKGRATVPSAGPDDPAPVDPTRDIAAMIAVLPEGDAAALVALLKSTKDEPREAWREALPALAAGLQDAEIPALLLAAPEAGSPLDFLNGAWVFLDARNPKGAMGVLDSLGDPWRGEEWLVQAFIHLSAGEAEQARRAFGSAAAEGIPSGVRDLVAGRFCARTGDLKTAEKILRGAADSRAYGPYAMVLLAGGAKPADALSEADLVFSGCPDNPPSQKSRLMLLTLAGEHDQALAAFEKLSTSSPDDPSVFELGGDLYALRKEPGPAKDAYLRALELDPGSAIAHRNLASLYFAAGDRERGFEHLEAAIATAPKKGLVGLFGKERGIAAVRWEVALCRELCDLAVRRLQDEGGRETAEKYLRAAARAKPTSARPFVVLSELSLRSGDLAGAIEVLTEGSLPVSSGQDRAELLFRLAIRKLMAGDLKGYEEAVGGIAADTPVGRLVSRLGRPDPAGVLLIAGRPNCPIAPRKDRHQALATAVLGEGATAGDRAGLLALLAEHKIKASIYGGLDIRAALKAGTPVMVDRTVLSEDGAQLMLGLIVGYDSGLGAFLLDDPDPTGAVLIEESRVKGSLFYRMDPAGFTPEDEGQGVALAQAIAYLRKGKLAESFQALPRGVKHPISSFVRSRGALISGRGVMAAELIKTELADSPNNPIWHLLYAQTLLVNGDQIAARHAVLRAAELAHGFQGSVLYRRLIALSRLTPESEEEAISELREIIADRPDYLLVYRDLAGVYLSRGRFLEAYGVLMDLGRQRPESIEEGGYQQAVKNVMGGLASSASTTEELEPLIASDDVEVRLMAVRVAPRLAYQDASKLLIRMTRDADAGVRALSLRYIGLKRFEDAAEAVRATLADEDPLVRGAAAKALRGILERDAALDLVALLADEDPYVRSVAVNELQTLSGKIFGFDPRAPEAERGEAVRRWEAWVRER